VRETVSKFHDRVKYWELWNDGDRYHDFGHHMPNGWVGSTDEDLELLRSGSEEIWKIDPKLRILNGGFFTVEKDARHALNPDMAKRVTTEAPDTFDILAAFDTNPRTLLGPLAELRRSVTPPRPLWLTRVEQRGAVPEELVRRVVSAKAGGASAFIWMWALNFDSGWRGFLMPMASWKTKDRLPINRHSVFQMQSTGCAYIHAISLLRMLEPAPPIEAGTKGKWIFAFTSADPKQCGKVLAFWHEKDAADEAHPLKLDPGTRATLVDIYGNETPLAADPGGKVLLPIRLEPQYLRIE